jgi:hypothetical protein
LTLVLFNTLIKYQLKKKQQGFKWLDLGPMKIDEWVSNMVDPRWYLKVFHLKINITFDDNRFKN